MKNSDENRSRLFSQNTVLRTGLCLTLSAIALGLLLCALSATPTSYGQSINAQASDGDLDSTFGDGGIVTTPIGPGYDWAHGVVIQPDGKIVAAGTSNNGSNTDFTLARYGDDGQLDASFGNGGVVTTPIGPGHEYCFDVVLQSDGRIVAVGDSNNGTNYDIALVRYEADGELDTGFGNSGIVTTAVGIGDEWSEAAVIQPDGKIVVAGGWEDTTGHWGFAAVRYTSQGQLDASFGSGGIVTTTLDHGYGRAVGVQSDGKIVVAGYNSSTDSEFAVIRYNANGSLDTTFGSTGIVTTEFGSPSHAIAQGMVVQPDGKIVAVGNSYQGGNQNFALARYESSGNLDVTFGTAGIVTTPIGLGDDLAWSVAIQPNGKLVVVGYSYGSLNKEFAVARYNSSGALDTSFGEAGIATTPIGIGDDEAYAVALQPGKIVVVGYTTQDAQKDTTVVRYSNADTAQEMAWLPVSSPTTGTLTSVSVISKTEAWAVGGLAWDQSLVLHYDNGNWQVVNGISNPQDRMLYAVDMVGSNNGWAAGFETYMLHYQNGEWTPEIDARTDIHRGIDLLSNSDGWVAGTRTICCPVEQFGAIRHYTGSSWSLTAPTTNPQSFYDVSMVAADDGWIVGQGGVILHYTGGTWQSVTSPTAALLKAVDMVSAVNGWAVGEDGVILNWNGSDWDSVPSPVTHTLNALEMVSAIDGWAVGDEGTILHWDGKIWASATSPTTDTLNSVSMISSTHGWIVGDEGTILGYDVLRPVLISNYSSGQPGSFFTISGTGFPPNGTATIAVNGHILTDTVSVDASGSFAVILDTTQAGAGFYSVTATVNPSATTSFTLDPDSPLRLQEGSGPVLNVPSGIAIHKVYLPLTLRNYASP